MTDDVKDGYRWFKQMANGGAVTRYHTRRMLQPQSNAAHQWGVAMVLWAAGVANERLLAAALTHDIHEYETGDSPGHTKWSNPPFAQMLDDMAASFDKAYGLDKIELDEDERLLLKWADTFELVHHCIVEVRMGNTFAKQIISVGVAALRRLLHGWHGSPATPYPPDSVKVMTSTLFNEAQIFID